MEEMVPEKTRTRRIGELGKLIYLNNVNDEEFRRQIMKMLRKNLEMWDGSLGHIETTENLIERKYGTKPSHQIPYREGLEMSDLTAEKIETKNDFAVIEPAVSKWTRPVILIINSDGTMRVGVNYRSLNDVTMGDSYPLPRLDDLIDSFGDAAVFSTLHANYGYWKIPVTLARDVIHYTHRDLPIPAYAIGTAQ